MTLQFSHSFDRIVSEVSSSRSDTGQEQIYKGFARLIGLPGKILVAGKKLAAKLKDSIRESFGDNKNNNINNSKIKQPQLTQEKHQQLSKVSALPMTEPKLPKKVVVVTLQSLKKRKFKTSEKHKSQENVE